MEETFKAEFETLITFVKGKKIWCPIKFNMMGLQEVGCYGLDRAGSG